MAPAVVFAAGGVAAFAEVVECESGAPYGHEDKERVEALSREGEVVRKVGEVGDVDCWEKRPETVHLAEVAGNAAEKEGEYREALGDEEGREEGVGSVVECEGGEGGGGGVEQGQVCEEGGPEGGDGECVVGDVGEGGEGGDDVCSHGCRRDDGSHRGAGNCDVFFSWLLVCCCYVFFLQPGCRVAGSSQNSRIRVPFTPQLPAQTRVSSFLVAQI